MTGLIVALDVPNVVALRLVTDLRIDTAVRFFKLGVVNLLDEEAPMLIKKIIDPSWPGNGTGSELMLDLKLRDTPDTVKRVVRTAFELGARFVTVTAEEAVVRAAVITAAKHPLRYNMILPVGTLTSNPTRYPNAALNYVNLCGGAVLQASDLDAARRRNPHAVLVTPGVRLVSDGYDDHDPLTIVTPAVARYLGADYVVVGRPITGAADPVAAARAYLKDLE